jgi:hypothetical protein
LPETVVRNKEGHSIEDIAAPFERVPPTVQRWRRWIRRTGAKELEL